MNEQADGLQNEIDDLQGFIMKSSNTEDEQKSTPSPTQKDLKDYSNKLQDEFLNSDQNIKV